jgi:DNA-binding SARP family transcriptional activator/predicted ATPase
MSALDLEAPAAAPSLCLFGAPAFTLLGREIAFTAERPFQLLGYLACRGGWVPRDELADLLYPARPLDAARSNLRKVLHLARRIEGVGDIEQHGELLRWQPDSDLQRFEDACNRQQFAAAVALYGGPLLQGFEAGWPADAAAWLLAERQRLESRWHEACLRQLERLQAEPAAAAQLAQKLLRHDPLDEQALAAYARGQAALGRQADALEALAGYSRRVAGQLGVEPSLGLQRLAQELRAEANQVEARRHSPSSVAPGALFRPIGLVGRRHELALITARLADPQVRLLTLLGPAGIGKSALARAAMQAAGSAPAGYTGGQAWVSLEGVAVNDAVPARIAAALGLEIAPGSAPWDALAQALGAARAANGRRLVVLDNAEPLIDTPGAPGPTDTPGAAGIRDTTPPPFGNALSQLLAACPALTLLITSRSALGTDVESRLPIEGLPLPDADETDPEVLLANDAVRLFVERAQPLAPGFDLAREAAAVVRLVHAVHGLPLALELLAPWRRLMPAPEIVSELETSLEVLDGHDADRGVRASFERSWRMLGVAEQRVLSQMALLPAPVSRAMARQVLEAPLPVLAALVDRSLVHAEGDGCFTLHPLIRRLAAPHAGDAAALRARHAHDVARRLHRPDAPQSEMLAAVAAEIDHARAAWDWAVAACDASVLQGLAGALAVHERFRAASGQRIAAFEAAVQALDTLAPQGPAPLPVATALARVLAGLADLHYGVGALDAAEASALRCTALANELPDDGPLADAMLTLNSVHWQRGDYEGAMQWIERYREHAVRSGSRLREAHALTSRGLALTEMGRHDEALQSCQAARVLLHAIGETVWLPTLLNNMGNLLRMMGRRDEAVEALQEGLHWARRHAMVNDRPHLLTNLAIAQEDLGDAQAALATVTQALAEATEHGEPNLRLYALLTQGRVRAICDRSAVPAMKSVWLALGVAESLGLAWTQHDCVITAGRIWAFAGDVQRGAALLQWVIAQADAHESCHKAAQSRLDKMGLDAAALDAAARSLPARLPMPAVLATLPGRYD